jgi:hypothetical protein
MRNEEVYDGGILPPAAGPRTPPEGAPHGENQNEEDLIADEAAEFR